MSAYLLTNACKSLLFASCILLVLSVRIALQLFYAKFYFYFKVKRVFLACLAIFEIGSVICATAPTSSALVVGRAVAGIGGAGLFIGGTIASAEVAPLHLQPLIIGIMGGVFGVCSVVGPLVSKSPPPSPPGNLAVLTAFARWAVHSRPMRRGDGAFTSTVRWK